MQEPVLQDAARLNGQSENPQEEVEQAESVAPISTPPGLSEAHGRSFAPEHEGSAFLGYWKRKNLYHGTEPSQYFHIVTYELFDGMFTSNVYKFGADRCKLQQLIYWTGKHWESQDYHPNKGKRGKPYYLGGQSVKEMTWLTKKGEIARVLERISEEEFMGSLNLHIDGNETSGELITGTKGMKIKPKSPDSK